MRTPGAGKVHIQVTIDDSPNIARIAKNLRKHENGKVLRLELTRGIRAELRPIVQAVKAAYGSGRKLRPALARATRAQVKTSGKGAGARVMVDGSKMPAGMGSLPAYREGEGTWRHPVYGRDIWVTQPAVPVFYRTVEPFVVQVSARIDRIAADIEKQMAGG